MYQLLTKSKTERSFSFAARTGARECSSKKKFTKQSGKKIVCKVGVSPREVILEQNGRRVHKVQTGEQPVKMSVPQLELAPGVKVRMGTKPAPHAGTQEK